MTSIQIAEEAYAKKNYQAAVDTCLELIESQPTSYEAHRLLLHAYLDSGKIGKARAISETLLEMVPDAASRGVYLRLNGMLNFQVGQFGKSGEAFEELLTTEPGDMLALGYLGQIEHRSGHREKALSHIDKLVRVIALQPISAVDFVGGMVAQTLYRGALIAPADTAKRWLEILLALDQGKIQLEHHFQFALGLLHDTLGQADAAYRCFQSANAFQRRLAPYDLADDLQRIDWVFENLPPDFFTPDRKASVAADDPVPIFLVGMPRSGTTLAASILGAHSAVHATGESAFLSRALVEQVDALQKEPGRSPPDAVEEFDSAFFQGIRQRYLALQHLPEGTRYFLDSMPSNLLYVWVVLCAFPDAKVVMLSREKLPTLMSCYSTSFATQRRYTEDLAECGRYFDACAGLASHWLEVSGGALGTLTYESLIADAEAGAGELLEAAGLAPEPACFVPRGSEDVPATADTERQDRLVSVNANTRWEPYRPFLDAAGVL